MKCCPLLLACAVSFSDATSRNIGFDKMEISADAISKLVRRQNPGATAAVPHSTAGEVPKEAMFRNPSFEFITKVTDDNGQETYSYMMPLDADGTTRSPIAMTTENSDGWQFSGDVKLVPTRHADYGLVEARDGGVFASLLDRSADISQVVEGHISGGFYLLAFSAATKPLANPSHLGVTTPVAKMQVHLEGAKSRDQSAGHLTQNTGTAVDIDPDWGAVQCLSRFTDYDFMYEADNAAVTITVENQSPENSLNPVVYVDDFQIELCGHTLEEAIRKCGDDGETNAPATDGTKGDGEFLSDKEREKSPLPEP